MSALPPGAVAPDFKLPLVGGKEVSLKQMLAKGPVVLAFFKISCPVCQYAFPYFERLARSLKHRGVAVVGVSQDDEKDTASFLRHFGVTFPVARDDENDYPVSRAYGLTNVPTVFEIAPDGKITASIVGWSRSEIEDIHARYMEAEAQSTPLFSPGEEVADFRPG